MRLQISVAKTCHNGMHPRGDWGELNLIVFESNYTVSQCNLGCYSALL